MKRDLMLWTAFFAGPVIWLLSFGARWSLSGWVCAFQNWKPALLVIVLVSIAILAGSGLMAWNQWQRVGRELPGEGGGAVARSRYLALLGVVLCVFSILLIVAQAVPEVVLGVCE
jgi:ABC-type Fe3+-siderophore transport system permease subunit